jgi:hypothetical protein
MDELTELFNIEVNEFQKKAKVSLNSPYTVNAFGQHTRPSKCCFNSRDIKLLMSVFVVRRRNIEMVHQGRLDRVTTSCFPTEERLLTSKTICKSHDTLIMLKVINNLHRYCSEIGANEDLLCLIIVPTLTLNKLSL